MAQRTNNNNNVTKKNEGEVIMRMTHKGLPTATFTRREPDKVVYKYGKVTMTIPAGDVEPIVAQLRAAGYRAVEHAPVTKMPATKAPAKTTKKAADKKAATAPVKAPAKTTKTKKAAPATATVKATAQVKAPAPAPAKAPAKTPADAVVDAKKAAWKAHREAYLEEQYGTKEERTYFVQRREAIKAEERQKLADNAKKTGKYLTKDAWVTAMEENVTRRLVEEGFDVLGPVMHAPKKNNKQKKARR